TIRTHDGREYPIEERQILQTKVQDPDLAIVTFESEQDYEIAPLGNSSQVNIQSDIFVAGFPTIFGRVGKDRSFTITNGKVVTFIDNPPKGYGLIYDATTRIGNSGGPVFDTEGKVIGIHGLADTDSLESDNTNQSETRNNLRPNPSTIRKLINPQTESGGSFQVKTGFNAGIPINILYGVLPQNYFNARSITPPSPSISTPQPSAIPTPIPKPTPSFNSATGPSSPSFYNPNPSESNPINVDRRYAKLETLLKAQDFRAADEETDKVILAVAKREEEGYLRREDAEKFPCKELRSIDQLWLKYSRGKFGISVQQQIYQSLGGTKEYNSDVWESMADRVGWRQGGIWLAYSDLNFSQIAPSGLLPTTGMVVFGLHGAVLSLLSRHAECNT
ncbi:MAG: GUN4 domain-containing protein, partial [Cylindrospermopsis raciborskii]|uniref:GUN4 domain-containing protein n=1 Tax=Cylindrospermopsis raciborskii TaxID=77022 RepID=UPI003D0CE7F5